MRTIISICTFILMGNVALAQNQQDTLKSQVLSELIIVERSTISRDQMKDVDGAIIYAGKKSEVIRPGALNGDLSVNNNRQVFGRVPGVNIWESDGSGIQTSIATRGLSPNRSWEFNVRQNGYDIAADPLGYPEAYYAPPIEAVERIEFLRGGASLAFGPQFGGALNYILKRGNTGKPLEVELRQTVGSYALSDSYIGIGGTYKKLSYYTYLQSRSADGWRENSRYNTLNAHGYIGYAINAKMKVSLEYTHMDYASQQPGGLTDAQFKENPRQSSRERNWMGTPWNILSLNYTYQIKEHDVLDLKVFSMFSERNSVGFNSAITVQDSVQFNRTVDSDQYNNLGAELRYQKTYFFKNIAQTFTGGVRFFNGETQRNQRGKGTAANGFDLTLVDPKWGRSLAFNSQNSAVFVENAFRIGKRFLVSPGARLEMINSKAQGYTSASGVDIPVDQSRDRMFLLFGVSSEYHITERIEAYAGAAQSYRPVMFSDLTPSSTTDVIDEDLQDASGYTIDGGVRGRWGNGFYFDLGTYYILYENRIGRVTENGVVHVRNVGATETYGAELYAEMKPTAWFRCNPRKTGSLNIFVSSAYNNATYITWNNPAAAENSSLSIVGNRVEYAPQNINRVGATYQFRKFEITYQWNMSSDFYTDANNTEEATANAQAGKLSGYQVSDLTLVFKPQEKYYFSIGANNLTNEMYATRRSGGYPGPGLLPANGRTFFATVSVKI